jgi:transcriptional regulator with XRE-family HTH domain
MASEMVTEMKRPFRAGPGIRKAPDAMDRHVGSRVRAQRLMLGFSQMKLADALNLTFQQVQKYEKGVNRIGAGRLSQIAQILGVPVAFFFEGFSSQTPTQSRSAYVPNLTRIGEFLATKEGVQLMTSFLEIRDESLRRQLVALTTAIALSQSSRGSLRGVQRREH